MEAPPRAAPDSSAALEALQILLKQQQQQSKAITPDHLTELALPLLGCSAALDSIVHAECRGKLHARMPRASRSKSSKAQATAGAANDPAVHSDATTHQQSKAQSQMMWLSKHAPLLRSLHLTLDAPQVEAATAAGLSAAAAAEAESLLPLAELQLCSSTSGQLLSVVAATSSASLTSLRLTLPTTKDGPSNATALPVLSAALANLTSLQRLQLSPSKPPEGTNSWDAHDWPAYFCQLGSGIAQLTALKELVLGDKVLLLPSDVALLPAGLKVLTVASRAAQNGRMKKVYEGDPEFAPGSYSQAKDINDTQPLNLSRFNRLTSLTLALLTPSDKLPASVQQLHLMDSFTFKPVRQCKALQQLTVKDESCQAPLPELKAAVSKLQQLQAVRVELTSPWSIGYGGGEFMPWTTGYLGMAARKLAGIKQLKELRARGFYLLRECAGDLGRCSQITSLSVTQCGLAHDDDGPDLYWSGITWSKGNLVKQLKVVGNNLRKLTNLTHLELQLDMENHGDGVASADVAPVVQAVQALPKLESMHVKLTTNGRSYKRVILAEVSRGQQPAAAGGN